jgi:8-oxo-dGTP diphosphatase
MAKQSIPQSEYMFSDSIKFIQKAVIFSGNKFLIIKRSPDAFNRANTWDLPGGCVSFGEEHEASLRREIKEETGLSVDPLVLLQFTTDYDKKTKIYTFFTSFVTKTLSKKVILSKEHTDYKWSTLDEFIKLESASFLQNAVKIAVSR